MADAAAIRTLGAKLLAQATLRETAGVFFEAAAREGIAVAPIKGLVVSALLYDEPLDRPFGDIDVLVGRRDLRALEALARRRGWGIVFDSKQLWTLNVVLPPGIPVDARASIGPPTFAPIGADEVLGRATRIANERVASGSFLLIDSHDHFLILLVDALMDKLWYRAAIRRSDLVRAVHRWVRSPEAFGQAARTAGLATASALVLRWLEDETQDARVGEVRRALDPLPAVSGRLASVMARELGRDPSGWASRIGVRLIADQPIRAVSALALGVVGTTRFHLRHRGKNPWAGRIWRGPGSS